MSKTARATAEPVNRVRLIGVVTGAPEERVLPSGTGIVRFRMVVAREPSAMTSGSKVRSDWFECSAWTAAERRRALRLSVGDRIESREPSGVAMFGPARPEPVWSRSRCIGVGDSGRREGSPRGRICWC